MSRLAALAVAIALTALPADAIDRAQPQPNPPLRGFTHAPAIARVYDTILDADFDAVPGLLAATCGAAPPEACRTLDALAVWWHIAIDPKRRGLDAQFTARVERAIADTTAWTRREPGRAEAWFYLGAAYGARVQFRVERKDRLAAARDGKRINEALERAIHLDPAMHDAKFGIGLYRYYADVAPAALRVLRFLLLLPGGDRTQGLQQVIEARERGQLVRGEATYQLHLMYLWYEKRHRDGLALVKELQARYPRNPLFYQIEADIHDEYLDDPKTSAALLRQLIDRCDGRRVNDAATARARAIARLAAIASRDR